MLNLYKKKGETPLERLDRWRKEKPAYESVTLSYAGRLDPMAKGVLLVMEGEENNERDKYFSLDKVYESEILFGISTDTHDVLGIVEKVDDEIQLTKEKINKEIKKKIGAFTQKYPNYSSRTVGGVPLFEYARNNKIVDVPEREVTLYKANVISVKKIKKEELLRYVLDDISKVKGDFRQKEIVVEWKRALATSARQDFLIAKLKLFVSSGFYVRVFADTLGKSLGTCAIAFSIKRTQSGIYKIEDSL